MSFWRHVSSGPDNATPDVSRVLTIGVAVIWFLGAMVFLLLAILDYLHTQTFNPKDYAFAFGTLITSGAGVVTLGSAGIAFKASTEPKQGGNP